MSKYTSIIVDLINQAEEVNRNKIDGVAYCLYECIKNAGTIYLFGCGHSSLVVSDCFYRAGGLTNIQPIFVPALMLHESASLSSKLEKDEVNAKSVLADYNITENDILFVISVSGINGVPIEIAKEGCARGAKVIGLCSSNYFNEQSRHSSGLHLKDYCNICIDNCVPKGDAVLELRSGATAVPVSTAVTSYLVQCCIYEALLKCQANDIQPKIFGSGNISCNVKSNDEIVEDLKGRIKFI